MAIGGYRRPLLPYPDARPPHPPHPSELPPHISGLAWGRCAPRPQGPPPYAPSRRCAGAGHRRPPGPRPGHPDPPVAARVLRGPPRQRPDQAQAPPSPPLPLRPPDPRLRGGHPPPSPPVARLPPPLQGHRPGLRRAPRQPPGPRLGPGLPHEPQVGGGGLGVWGAGLHPRRAPWGGLEEPQELRVGGLPLQHPSAGVGAGGRG